MAFIENSYKVLEPFLERSIFERFTSIQIVEIENSAPIPWDQKFSGTINFYIAVWIYMHDHVIIILEIFVLLLWQRIQKGFNLSNSTYSTFVGFILTFFAFRGWNGILEFESRRNKSSTYFSFRTGKYFASQEAPFLLSWIKTIHDQHSNALKFKSSIQRDHFYMPSHFIIPVHDH